jgi:hypothetical protein
VRAAVPGSKLSFAASAGPDLRNYKVDFAKLDATFPGLDLQWTVRAGIAEMAREYAARGLSYDDFTGPRFVRLRRISQLLEAGLIDEDLRRRSPDPFPRP